MRTNSIVVALAVAFSLHAASAAQSQPNVLTDREKEDGWKLLFDGRSFDGWHRYGGSEVGSAWHIADGAITLIPREEENWQELYGGDIVTDEEFQDFELKLEWRISEGGNSGIFYLVNESDEYSGAPDTGPEMQVLDNDRHPDGQYVKHRAGDLYDLIEADTVATRPVGEWNQVRIVKKGPHVEHWMNGRKIVDYELWTDEWKKLVAGSKFADWKGFADYHSGKIALQDHGDWVAYRSVKVRPL